MADENKIEIESGIVPSLKDAEIVDEVKSSFLDYAMSVIISRALPDVRDGLKPVTRRIIYCMDESGYTPDKPFVKCAKVVGDVMGKYHPHGDSSIYMAMVRLAQDFSMRYPLVDGHGNFGTMDGDDPAAYRYTEARLEKLALEMVRDINLNTVDFSPNYDGNLEEPNVLPAHFPNLLVNGSDGIAVGMATKMPPHNLTEVICGIQAYAKNPDISVEELMTIIKGPDFPTGGIVYGLNGIRDYFATGRGTFTLRSKTQIVEESNGKSKIIITEIPYQTNKASIVAKVGELYRDKKIEGITSIKDFSKANVHIEIECKKDAVASVVLNQLFKNTQLETSYGVINLAIVDGVPRVLTLKELLQNYLDFQIEVVRRRTLFLLDKDEKRKHIIEGLLICRENIDEIVQMVKDSENNQDFIQKAMASRFQFSEVQASAIITLQLGRLTHLENTKLLNEKAQLESNIEKYHLILSSRENMKDVVLNELEEIKTKFGDERKTVISNEFISIEDEDLIPEEDIVITLTSKGYIKRMPSSEFRAQRRGGKGIKGMTTYEDDEVDKLVYSKTHTDILFFSNLGRVYRKRGYEIAEGSRIAKGNHIGNLLNLDKDENIVSIIAADDYENKYLFFATKKGLVKRVKLEEFIRINSNGKYAIKFNDEDNLLDVKVTDGKAKILLASNAGQLAMFEESQVRAMGRSAKGVGGMKLGKNYLVSLATSNEGNLVFVVSENGLGKLSKIEDYRETKRNSKGVKTIKITKKTGNLCAMKVVNGDEDYLAITNSGIIIRSPLSQVRLCGRNSQGVILMNVKNENDHISSLTILPHEEEANEETEVENLTNEEIK